MNGFVCPICGTNDQIQSVKAIVDAGTASGVDVSASTGWQSTIGTSYGKGGSRLTIGGGPTSSVVSTHTFSQTQLARQLTLEWPSEPSLKGKGSLYLSTLVIAGMILIGAGSTSGGAVFIFLGIPLCIIMLLFNSNKIDGENETIVQAHDARLNRVRKQEQQWDHLYFCYRDNVVFIPGDGRNPVQPSQMITFLESPPRPPRALPIKQQQTSSAVAKPIESATTEVYHLMLEAVGENYAAVVGLVAKFTSVSKMEAETLVAKAPTRIMKLSKKDEAEKSRELLEAIGASVTIMRESAPSKAESRGASYNPQTSSKPSPTDSQISVRIQAKVSTPFRAKPETEAQASGQMSSGQALSVRGRNSESTWLSITRTGTMWVNATDIHIIEGDVNSLPVIQPPE